MALFGRLIATNRLKSIGLVALFILFHGGVAFVFVLGVAVALMGSEWALAPRMLVVWGLVSHAASLGMALLMAAGGAQRALAASGAKPASAPEWRQLRNLVEEMALAGGMTTPGVYVMPSDSLNAMAVEDARRGPALVFTHGLCRRLGRDELQAVVAHQLARMRSGDVALMTMVAGLVGFGMMAHRALQIALAAAIVLAMPVGHFVATLVELRARSLAAMAEVEEARFVPALVVILPLSLWLACTTSLAGRLIQLCVSRRRQFLADAEAARMTRYPEALACALEVMDSDDTPLHGATRATAHLFTVSPVLSWGRRAGKGDVWSSHPPIEERVARLRSIGNIEG